MKICFKATDVSASQKNVMQRKIAKYEISLTHQLKLGTPFVTSPCTIVKVKSLFYQESRSLTSCVKFRFRLF